MLDAKKTNRGCGTFTAGRPDGRARPCIAGMMRDFAAQKIMESWDKRTVRRE